MGMGWGERMGGDGWEAVKNMTRTLADGRGGLKQSFREKSQYVSMLMGTGWQKEERGRIAGAAQGLILLSFPSNSPWSWFCLFEGKLS